MEERPPARATEFGGLALASAFLELQAMFDDHGIGDWPGGAVKGYVEGLGCLAKGFIVLLVFAGAFHLLMAAGKWLIVNYWASW